MALIEYDVYKQKLRDLEPELKKLGDALDIDAVAQEAARLEDETTQDGFWNNLERSQKVQTRLKQLQNKLHRFKKLMSTWEDLTTLCEMGQEAEDEEILEEFCDWAPYSCNAVLREFPSTPCVRWARRRRMKRSWKN